MGDVEPEAAQPTAKAPAAGGGKGDLEDGGTRQLPTKQYSSDA